MSWLLKLSDDENRLVDAIRKVAEIRDGIEGLKDYTPEFHLGPKGLAAYGIPKQHSANEYLAEVWFRSEADFRTQARRAAERELEEAEREMRDAARQVANTLV